jgi:hypothetical protein
MMYLIAISQYGQHNLKFKKYFRPGTPSQLNVQITGFRGAEKNDSNQGTCWPVCQDAELCRQSERCLTYSQGNLRYGLHYANPSRFTLNVSICSEVGTGVVVRIPAGMKVSPYKTSKPAL